jgi:RNA polymerase sigma-70 factor (ECF subfamily)
MDEAFSSARLAWPGIEISRAVFDDYLAERKAQEALETTDLYLACACIQRVPQALETFERHFMRRVPDFVARMRLSPPVLDDLCQQLRERLLLAHAGRPPRLAEYSGRGSLAAWLRVVATRAAIDLIRTTEKFVAEPSTGDRLVAFAASPELQYVKAEYRAPFREALAESIKTLSSQQRNVLRLYFVEDLTIVEIGALYRVGKSTVFRWLESTRDQVLTEARRSLQERLSLSAQEFDSIANALRSDLDFSLRALLRRRSPRARP